MHPCGKRLLTRQIFGHNRCCKAKFDCIRRDFFFRKICNLLFKWWRECSIFYWINEGKTKRETCEKNKKQVFAVIFLPVHLENHLFYFFHILVRSTFENKLIEYSLLMFDKRAYPACSCKMKREVRVCKFTIALSWTIVKSEAKWTEMRHQQIWIVLF